MERQIRALVPTDYAAMTVIYQEGIDAGVATFEVNVPSWEKWDAGHRPDCRLVVVQDDALLGWAALSPVSTRAVYRGVAEVTIYIAAAARGQGVGKYLLTALIAESEQAGVWTLQSTIFQVNHTSLALHKGCGFREVGFRERIASLHGVWHNTVLLERRSAFIGV